ncbi:Borrelia lipoprotein-containing protein (plasmid) [Borrelia crocidurae str. Achema]|uniref:Variable large protein n=1 Tax=Borrelia crocidurae (strain Achema) TaxID=1155096 RepID=I0FEP2_BORCA|nr:Borrelia lipoprotein-containing protein [Borrelia crocidurae str. Achema]
MIDRVMIMMMVVVMVMGCNSGGVGGGEGKVDLAKKNSFLESLVKIGEGFQEIFGVFGSAVGDTLGFAAVKSDDKKNKVGEHFRKMGGGLTATKNKLNDLLSEISSAKNVDGSTIEVVKGVIKGANDVFERLITALTKLFGATTDSASIGDNAVGAGVGADKTGVEAVIGGIKTIVEEAVKVGIEIKPGNAGGQIAAANATTDAIAVLGGFNNNATAGSGPKLAAEVSKADSWAMIDKIKDATATILAQLTAGADKDAGTLAASNGNAAG